MIQVYLFLIIFIFSSSIYSNDFVEMTLEKYMEDYVKPADKKYKNGDTKYLLRSLEVVPSMAIDDYKQKWTDIMNEAKNTGDYRATCKSCHKLHKKEYHKTYKNRLIQVPLELLNFLSQ